MNYEKWDYCKYCVPSLVKLSWRPSWAGDGMDFSDHTTACTEAIGRKFPTVEAVWLSMGSEVDSAWDAWTRPDGTVPLKRENSSQWLRDDEWKRMDL